ncbi:flavin reductase family protein [Paenibacillus sp. Marseille-P2973]|uniref:flavin reductase family protein n=1 Tax=Paenibacillus sp. Marseille-P2973 TaxID=1871032 RepID=UPI001B35B592|nr:flavin reductase family protein [Paenibacillus sp. Marseille-P2973]MBQ4900476.1 flavin reductase family protein [Paenibacillus sp. Marseille-P2973]
MLSIDPNLQSERDNYKLLTGSIIPRPVAFVTTLSGTGVLNAAPFSYFNIVTADPPMISVSVQRKQGLPKDTARNAMELGAFVVHISDESNIEQINEAAAALPPDESEIALAGLTPVPSESIPVPGVAEAKVRMECVLERAIQLGGTAEHPAADLLIGRVVRFHIAESVYEGGRITAAELKAISRLAGNDYAALGPVFSIRRPE